MNWGQLGEQIESSWVAVHTLGMRRGWPDVSVLPRLIRLLRTLTPTIVQSWLYHADLLCMLAVKWSGHSLLLRNLRCSNMDLTKYRPLTRWVQRMLACWSAAPAVIVVNSEAGKQAHKPLRYHPRRWETLPNGFDLDRFRPGMKVGAIRQQEWRIPDDAVALVARVDAMKNHATFWETHLSDYPGAT